MTIARVVSSARVHELDARGDRAATLRAGRVETRLQRWNRMLGSVRAVQTAPNLSVTELWLRFAPCGQRNSSRSHVGRHVWSVQLLVRGDTRC
jgi:hypothetical protein